MKIINDFIDKISFLNSSKWSIFFILFSAILLCFVGFYNRFPLFFFDSAVYIYPAFQYYIPKDRPVVYGFLARIFSLDYSLWFAILDQGLILSISIFYYFKYLMESKFINLLYFLFILIITFLTNVSVHVSIIMPDIFTSIAILNLGLLFFVRKIGKFDFIIILSFLFISLPLHNSHFVILPFILFIVSFLMIFRKIRAYFNFFTVRRLITLWGIVLAAFLASGTIHYVQPRTGEWVKGHFFTTGQGGSVFLIAKLNLDGILKSYLQENCTDNKYKLCEYADSIPPNLDFLWSDDSPLYKTGGWYANKKEFQRLAINILTTPKYLVRYICSSFKGSFVLFFRYDAIDLPVIKDVKWADEFITTCYPLFRNNYKMSLQNHNKINPLFHTLNACQRFVVGVSLVFLALFLFLPIPAKNKLLIIFFLLALYINALVCSSLSAIDPRYQSRVVWLLFLPVIISFFDKDIYKGLIGKLKNLELFH